MIGENLDEKSLDIIFRKARSPQKWLPHVPPQELLERLYDLVKLGPTSGNCCPGRFVFIGEKTTQREKLRPALSQGNINKVMGAPIIAIVAWDPVFFEQLPTLHPQSNLRSWYAADVGLAEETAFRNSTLQGAYMMLAARSLGLDALAISGFDAATVDKAFLSEQKWRSNFLLCLGYGDFQDIAPRDPRLSFSQACRILS